MAELFWRVFPKTREPCCEGTRFMVDELRELCRRHRALHGGRQAPTLELLKASTGRGTLTEASQAPLAALRAAIKAFSAALGASGGQ